MSSEVRPFLPIDLPLVHRLAPQGVSLDTATSLTHGVHTVGGAVWSTLPLTDLGTPTLVMRDGDRAYLAQFRHKAGSPHAHIVFIAPDLQYCPNDTAWLTLIDAMLSAAGRRGAMTLNAEVSETSEAFEVLRQSGFAVYARQDVWARSPGPLPQTVDPLFTWREETESDRMALTALYTSVVPRTIWQADSVPEGTRGLIYEPYPGHIAAYVAIQEGRSGLCAQMVIRPEWAEHAEELCRSWLLYLPRVERMPLYICVRRYQSWLANALGAFGFQPLDSCALLVKHTVARIERPLLRNASVLEGVILTMPIASGTVPTRPRVRRSQPVEPSVRQPS